MTFSFTHADGATYRSELEAAGDAFVAQVRGESCKNLRKTAETEPWTEFVLNWWSQCCAQDAHADSRRPRGEPVQGAVDRPRESFGEFMLDLCHSTYPKPSAKYDRGYYEDALRRPRLELLLALESEWGKQKSRDESFSLVLDDASKLAHVRAATKVMIFASIDAKHHAELAKAVRSLRHRAGDKAPWLLIDVPWNDDSAVSELA